MRTPLVHCALVSSPNHIITLSHYHIIYNHNHIIYNAQICPFAIGQLLLPTLLIPSMPPNPPPCFSTSGVSGLILRV